MQMQVVVVFCLLFIQLFFNTRNVQLLQHLEANYVLKNVFTFSEIIFIFQTIQLS